MRELIRHILREHILEQKNSSKSYTDDEIEIEARKYSNQADFAKGSPSYYNAFKRRKLQSKFRDFLPLKIKKWTNELLQKEALKYNTMVDFLKNSGSAYKTAYDRGILDDITQHIPKTKMWTYEEAEAEAKKYETFPEFQKNSLAFYQSQRNGWTEDFKKFLKLGKYEWKKYTKDMVIADVAKSVNRNDFRSKFPMSYKAARENGWYEEVTQPLILATDDRNRLVYAFEFPDKSVYIGLTVDEKRRKLGHLDLEDVTSPVAIHILETGLQPTYKVISKDLTPSQSQDMEGCTTEKYRLEGWKILNRYKTGSLGACRRFWTKEMVEEIASKYKSRGEFKKNDRNAYQAAQKYGWLEEVTKNMSYADTTVWTYDKTKQLAKTVETRSQLKEKSQSAYFSALKNGWLDEFFPLKTQSQKDDENYKAAKEESKKYKTRMDFYKGAPSLYNISRIMGWLDEFIPKSDKTYNQSDTTDFIKKAKSIHGDKYDYSSIDYKNSHTNVLVNCRDHGPFPISPSNHLGGGGCPICANISRGNARRSNKNDFVEKAKKIFGDEYDYSLVDYKNNYTPVSIICSKHGPFPKSPQNHLKGQGCPKCKEETNYRGSSQRKNNI